MTEEEFLPMKRTMMHTLYQRIIYKKDPGIIKTKKYAPLWIDVSCRHAKKRIYATVHPEHLCVYRGLMPQLMNPDMDVKLLFNEWPSDMKDIMMVSTLMQAGRAKVCKTNPNWSTLLSVDLAGFLVEQNPNKYYLSANNFTIAKKISEIITDRWHQPSLVASHMIFNPFDYLKKQRQNDSNN